MSWQSILTIITRQLIGDFGDTLTYTDERIETAIVTAAYYVVNEFDFINDYTLDLETPDITPDPTDEATYDTQAIALFPLKAACILNMNAYTGAVGNGIKVRDGDSEVDTTGSFKGYLDIIRLGPCKAYENLLQTISVNSIGNSARAITTPVATSWYGNHYPILHADRFYNSLF